MLYFTLLVFFCSLIMLNMVLAVITDSFNKNKEEMLEKRRFKTQSRITHKLHMLCYFLRLKVLLDIKRDLMIKGEKKRKENYE